MSARHFKTVEPEAAALPEEPEHNDAQPEPAEQTDLGAKTIPMEEPYAELSDEGDAQDPGTSTSPNGNADPTFQSISAPLPAISPHATGGLQSAQQDYTPGFDFEEQHSGYRTVAIFIVVFALFFACTFVYLHFFAR